MELHWAIWVGIIIGGIILISVVWNILSDYMLKRSVKQEQNRWKRNVSPDVKPGPLIISYDAYSEAKRLFQEMNPIADLYLMLGTHIAQEKGSANFRLARLLSCWMLAYDLQAKKDNYPKSLHLSEGLIQKANSADNARVQKDLDLRFDLMSYISPIEMDEMANKMNMGFKAPADQVQGIFALYLLSKTWHIGNFREDLQEHLITSQGDPYVSKFIKEIYGIFQLVEYTTERLVKENKVNS